MHPTFGWSPTTYPLVFLFLLFPLCCAHCPNQGGEDGKKGTRCDHAKSLAVILRRHMSRTQLKQAYWNYLIPLSVSALTLKEGADHRSRCRARFCLHHIWHRQEADKKTCENHNKRSWEWYGIIVYKGTFQKLLSGFCPLRGVGVYPPFR